MSVKFDFSGRKAIVTGGTRGIGREICISLANAGAEVIALHTSADVAPFDQKHANKITPLRCDVSQSRDHLSTLLSAHLPVHYLVNNAGIGALSKFDDITADQVQNLLSVNVQGALVCSQIVIESMLKHNIKGAVVNMSSQASMLPLKDHTTYCLSKAALDALTRNMALELGPRGVRVNSVNPTVVWTELAQKAWSDPIKAKTMLDRIPLGHFAEVGEVANAVLFLLSDAASMTTAHAFPVDRGATNC